MKDFAKLQLLLIFGVLFAALPALADSFTLSLSTVNPTVTPGNTVTFNGLITASATNTADIFLLGSNLTVTSPLVGDDLDFYADTPLSLSHGGFYNGPLFTIMVPLGTASSIYNGSFQVSVLDVNGNQLTQKASFQATAAGTTAVTPEPNTWLLLLTGLAGATQLRRKSQPTI